MTFMAARVGSSRWIRSGDPPTRLSSIGSGDLPFAGSVNRTPRFENANDDPAPFATNRPLETRANERGSSGTPDVALSREGDLRLVRELEATDAAGSPTKVATKHSAIRSALDLPRLELVFAAITTPLSPIFGGETRPFKGVRMKSRICTKSSRA
jgi:hypothetical protein